MRKEGRLGAELKVQRVKLRVMNNYFQTMRTSQGTFAHLDLNSLAYYFPPNSIVYFSEDTLS